MTDKETIESLKRRVLELESELATLRARYRGAEDVGK